MKNSRIKFLFTIFVVIIVIGLFKIANLNNSIKRVVFDEPIPSLRGKIFDCNGQLLAASVPYYVAYFDVSFFKRFYNPSYDIDIDLLESRFNVKMDFNKRFIRLGEAFDIDTLKQKIPTELRKFVNISVERKRFRLDDFGLGMIIGTVKDNRGISGVEKIFDNTLSEKSDGKVILEISGSVAKTATISGMINPVDGKDLKLTIDVKLQEKLYELAMQSKEKYNAENVGMILMETSTGKIRAMVTTNSWPDYYMGYIEPGSAMKPMFYAAALDFGVVSNDSTFICNGYIYPDEDLNIKITDVHSHGVLNLKDAISKSCNVAAVLTSKRLIENYDKNTLYNILRTFGFGEKTGIELPNEIDGVLKEIDKWSKIEWAYLPIGYSIGVTPIQLITAYNSIFNNGVLIKPRIVENTPIREYRVITEKTSKLMLEYLKDVVENGTGRLAKIPGMSIYGKTGTSEIEKDSNKYIMTFEGNFELKGVKYTALVWVRNPKGYDLSSYVATPIFREMVLRIKEHFERNNDDYIYVVPGIVPNVAGWNLRQLLSLKDKFEIEIKGKGPYVLYQYPNPGTLSNKFTVYLGEKED